MQKRTKTKNVVYLFGAGSTHAEILNFKGASDETFLSENGLKISDVSKRVMKFAQDNPEFKKDVEEVTYREGPVNIELLISLFESNQIPGVDYKVACLKKAIEIDIKKILTSNRKKKFYLHKALFELHQLIKNKETLMGVITLNYDDVLDQAYEEILKCEPDYCHVADKGSNIPLLKLHGSFNWTKIKIYGKIKNIPIIPLGINKNYLIPPYNFIWGRAFEVLAKCDILRIIGCSLSQNDVGLVDLLFKAHLERSRHFIMEIINQQNIAEDIRDNYGFFPGIITPKDIEDSLIAEDLSIEAELSNPFKTWLKAKAERMLKERISRTKYLKKCL